MMIFADDFWRYEKSSKNEKTKRVWRGNRVGDIRGTCPSHLVDCPPTETLQSGTPSISAHLSLVMCCSRMRTQEIPSIPRIFSYQNLLIRRHAASGRGQFSQLYSSVEHIQTRNSRRLIFFGNFLERQSGFILPYIFVASFTRLWTSSKIPNE